jgi:hypothetical protein
LSDSNHKNSSGQAARAERGGLLPARSEFKARPVIALASASSAQITITIRNPKMNDWRTAL